MKPRPPAPKPPTKNAPPLAPDDPRVEPLIRLIEEIEARLSAQT